MQELWHPIEGADGYEVSNLGRIRVTRYLQTARGGSNGYRTVTLPGGRQRYVHRLVAQAFVENPEGLPEVNHIDSDPSNAAASNLEWIDSKKNKLHAIKKGNRKVKMTEDQVRDIRKRLAEGASLKEAGAPYGLEKTYVFKIKKRELYDWVA